MVTAADLREGIVVQGRVLHALLLREIRTRFGKHRIGYAWALVEPALHITILYGLRSVIGGLAPQHIPMLLWLITGIIPFFLFRGTVGRVATANKGNSDILMLPQVRLLDVVWARALLELATYCAIFIFMLLFYVAVVGPVEVYNPLGVFGCLLLLWVLGIGFGMITCVFTSIFPSTQPLVSGVLRLLYFFSGAMFAMSRVPPDTQKYLVWNPLLHVFETLRSSFFFGYHPLDYASNLGYAGICALGMVVMGILLIKRFMRVILDS